MTISLKRGALSPAEGPIPDPLPALISELISYPVCEIDDEVRAVFAKGGKARCAFCRNAPVEEVDHIIPISLGGPDRLENYAGACQVCNMRKNNYVLPFGILGIMLMEARTNAPTRRALIEKRRARRVGVSLKRPKEIKPLTKRMPHHIRLSLPEDDLLDLIGLDSMFRGSIPMDLFPDRMLPSVERLLSGNLVEGPYADRLDLSEQDGCLTYSRQVASLWIALTNIHGELPQVMTWPDWLAGQIEPRSRRNWRSRFYHAHVSFPLIVAELLLRRAREVQVAHDVDGGVIDCVGAEANILYRASRSSEGICGVLRESAGGGSNLFQVRAMSRSRVQIKFTEYAVPALEAMISERSASVLMQESEIKTREIKIVRTVPVRPGLLFRAGQDWSATGEKIC